MVYSVAGASSMEAPWTATACEPSSGRPATPRVTVFPETLPSPSVCQPQSHPGSPLFSGGAAAGFAAASSAAAARPAGVRPGRVRARCAGPPAARVAAGARTGAAGVAPAPPPEGRFPSGPRPAEGEGPPNDDSGGEGARAGPAGGGAAASPPATEAAREVGGSSALSATPPGVNGVAVKYLSRGSNGSLGADHPAPGIDSFAGRGRSVVS